ncbi:phosphatidylserine/phosphatidylglycerophosphate/cardiolipin synthase family protein [Candidatus Saccharibacteria bacterium]|nr:phosphatidylserine/phosphatidylglycerophosphate/cardiolipin synthase family protein [Candidatus Saccharibacteria bacterium]
MQKNKSKPALLSPSGYAKDAVKKIDLARIRVAIVATTFRNDDALSKELVLSLCRAGDRGVAVSVYADTYTYTEPKEFVLKSPRRHPTRAYNAIKVERLLKKHGVQFHWLGRTSNIGFAGRTHSKWLIADTTVYSFGGVNVDGESFTNNDFMLRINDANLSGELFLQHRRMYKADRSGHATKCHSIHFSDKSRVLVDGGMLGDSIIYRRACALAKQATNITLVSQYCPTGRLNRILKKKKATLYFNHWKKAAWMNKIMIQFGMALTRQHTLYTGNSYLHAKFIIFTMPDKTKIAITGSHNFMFGSVALGTREIALETSDAQIITQLEQFLNDRVK